MSLGRAVATVGGFTLLSRLVGFARDVVLSAMLGSGALADAFFVAFKLPNLFRRLFAEGAFSAAFVPLFAGELQGEGRESALVFARQAHACLLMVLVPFTVLMIAAMPAVIWVMAPGFTGDTSIFDLAVTYGRITFPYLVFISLASLYGGVLNSIDRFAEVAFTPVLLNITLIGCVLGLTPMLPDSGYAAAIGVAMAGFLQWLWLLFSCWRDGVAMRLVRPRFTPRVRQLVRLATPVAVGGGAQQVSTVLEVVWASLLPAGSISALYYADRVAQLPLGVIGIAIGTALLPLLSRQLRAGAMEAAMANQNRALEFGLLFSVPSTVALWILAEPMIRVLFEHGKFGPDDTLRTAGALVAYAAGLPAFMLVKALTPGFFAREDTRTPLYTALVSIAVNVALNAVFVLATPLAQVGIALSSSLSGWLNAALLAVVLRQRGHWLPDARLVSRTWRIAAAAVGMGGVLWLGLVFLKTPLAHPDLAGAAALAVLVATGGVAYGLCGMVLGVVRIGEIKAAMRRPPNVTPADVTSGGPDAPP